MARSLYLRFRRGTAATWAATNPVLGAGEPGQETDTGVVKIGDGSTAWNGLGQLGIHPGGVVGHAGATAPAGWLMCDGNSYLRASYPALFAEIGTIYGAADGTHFSVPDLRGRFPIGVSAGLYTPGQLGGSNTHSHTLGSAWAQITAAGNLIALLRKTVTSFTSGVQITATLAANSVAETSGAALGGSTDITDHTPPYLAINYIIKT